MHRLHVYTTQTSLFLKELISFFHFFTLITGMFAFVSVLAAIFNLFHLEGKLEKVDMSQRTPA